MASREHGICLPCMRAGPPPPDPWDVAYRQKAKEVMAAVRQFDTEHQYLERIAAQQPEKWLDLPQAAYREPAKAALDGLDWNQRVKFDEELDLDPSIGESTKEELTRHTEADLESKLEDPMERYFPGPNLDMPPYRGQRHPPRSGIFVTHSWVEASYELGAAERQADRVEERGSPFSFRAGGEARWALALMDGAGEGIIAQKPPSLSSRREVARRLSRARIRVDNALREVDQQEPELEPAKAAIALNVRTHLLRAKRAIVLLQRNFPTVGEGRVMDVLLGRDY